LRYTAAEPPQRDARAVGASVKTADCVCAWARGACWIVDRADMDALKSFADARRHSGAGTSLHADQLRWTSWTREVLGRFLRRHSTAIQQGAAPSVPDAEDGSPAG
jgi:hypothetical protein